MISSEWTKSSRCDTGQCVEVRRVDGMILDEQWRKATKSNNNGACAAVRAIGGMVQIRDTKLGEDSPVLSFTAKEWEAFVDGAKNNEFEIA